MNWPWKGYRICALVFPEGPTSVVSSHVRATATKHALGIVQDIEALRAGPTKEAREGGAGYIRDNAIEWLTAYSSAVVFSIRARQGMRDDEGGPAMIASCDAQEWVVADNTVCRWTVHVAKPHLDRRKVATYFDLLRLEGLSHIYRPNSSDNAWALKWRSGKMDETGELCKCQHVSGNRLSILLQKMGGAHADVGYGYLPTSASH